MLLQTHFINSLHLVRKALKDLWVCPQSLDLSTASTDRLIILVLTQWNYKLFIPSGEKKKELIWEPNAAWDGFATSTKDEVHDSSRCGSRPGPLALIFALNQLGLQGETGTQNSCELLSALLNVCFRGSDYWFSNVSMQTISWRSEKHIKMWKYGLQSQKFQFSRCGVRSKIPMEWCSAASLGPLLGHLVAYPPVLISVISGSEMIFLELTEICESWKTGLVPRDEQISAKSKLSTKHNMLTPFIIKFSLHKNFIIFENNL